MRAGDAEGGAALNQLQRCTPFIDSTGSKNYRRARDTRPDPLTGPRGMEPATISLSPDRDLPIAYSPTCLKKSFPLSSTRMYAGKSFTSIFHTASMPSSGKSMHSTFVMFSCASTAAGPPMEPR